MRYSPDVRITRSGSGMSGSYRWRRMAFSSILSACTPVGHERLHRVDDLGPAAVVEGDGEGHAVRLSLGELDRLVHARASSRAAPASRAGR